MEGGEWFRMNITKKQKQMMEFPMWAHLKQGGQKANVKYLKECCSDLETMLMQKTAGQRENKPKDIDWNRLDGILVSIICETMALHLSGKLDQIKE